MKRILSKRLKILIMNKAFVLILFILLIIGTSNLSNEADAKEITNLQWKKV